MPAEKIYLAKYMNPQEKHFLRQKGSVEIHFDKRRMIISNWISELKYSWERGLNRYKDRMVISMVHGGN